MSSIFGDTDDITFGSGAKSLPPTRPAPKPQMKNEPPRAPSHSPSPRRDQHEGSTPSTSSAPRRETRRPAQPLSLPGVPSISESLRSLVESMKPSFLPSMPEGIIRVVLLSSLETTDPMMLVRSDDVTLVFGTGFSTIENAGKTYPTLPDMRLIASERDRLAGWVITETDFDISLFQAVIEMLGFPFVYATRDVIAYIRNSVKESTFTEKCRFFELFTTDTTERKISHFTLRAGAGNIIIQAQGKSFADEIHTSSDISGSATSSSSLSRADTSYTIASDPCHAGEIIDIVSSTKVAKQTLKFTFDTFYVDAHSVGVVAGYTLKDRAELATSGVLTFVMEEDIRMRAIVGHIFIDSRGFVHSYEMMSVHKEILKAIRHIYETTILANTKIERGELVGTLRRELTKYCYLLTGRTPVVMPVIIER